jgi:DNA-binding GntR family transcriptional regulator
MKKSAVLVNQEAGRGASSAALLSQRVTLQIKNLILSGELKPGHRIRQEELAAQVGTSRIPVREALRYLESEGLVILKPNSGAWVAKLDIDECLEIYKIRERIEPLALMESVPNLTDIQVGHLQKLVEKIEKSRGTEEFMRLDREFHIGTYGGANMPELQGLIQRYWNKTQQYRRAYIELVGSGGRQYIDYEHRIMIESLKHRDPQEAASLLHLHLRRTRLALARHPELFSVG